MSSAEGPVAPTPRETLQRPKYVAMHGALRLALGDDLEAVIRHAHKVHGCVCDLTLWDGGELVAVYIQDSRTLAVYGDGELTTGPRPDVQMEPPF